MAAMATTPATSNAATATSSQPREADAPAPQAAEALDSALRYQFEQRFVPSHEVMISCGCVPVDPAARKVAILRNTNDGFIQLPKGRKNIGEDILAAALRETFEETGIPFMALPLRVATRSTPTPKMLLGPLAGVATNSITTTMLNCEPSSISAYRCQSTLAFKIVFWFAAHGDSTAVADETLKEVWEQDLKLEWVSARDAPARMTFEADGKVIEKVLDDMRSSGYEI